MRAYLNTLWKRLRQGKVSANEGLVLVIASYALSMIILNIILLVIIGASK